MLRVVFDGGADAGDMIVDAAVEGVESVASEILHELVAGEDAPRVLGEDPKQLELVTRERAGLAFDDHRHNRPQ